MCIRDRCSSHQIRNVVVEQLLLEDLRANRQPEFTQVDIEMSFVDAEDVMAVSYTHLKTIFWSLAYVDWYKDDQPTKEQAFSKLIPRIHPGAVVLLHSTSDTNEMILDELLTKWKDLGYTFKTLDDLTAN